MQNLEHDVTVSNMMSQLTSNAVFYCFLFVVLGECFVQLMYESGALQQQNIQFDYLIKSNQCMTNQLLELKGVVVELPDTTLSMTKRNLVIFWKGVRFSGKKVRKKRQQSNEVVLKGGIYLGSKQNF